jgi:Lon protease-like protein
MGMFPLGTVLFPSLVLPLHVFEPRYRALTRDCLDGDREFGVVLIERGSEVGGGDVRTDVGTVARILEAEELDDGRWVLATVGVRRIRVERWLPDDPYPRAEIEAWEEPIPGDVELDGVVRRLRRVLGLSAELGEAAAPATMELADDPALATYQVAALAPLNPLDRQRVLATETAAERVGELDRLLGEVEETLTMRVEAG